MSVEKGDIGGGFQAAGRAGAADRMRVFLLWAAPSLPVP